ncbi:hypothetical protein PHACT_12765 [Pseudohongiella acticola]|uniref:Uncharacterized protein n=1 Tax=Pseudohongiella acticola TaxID=1524254 RepID=A0A1E8CGC4_9GAMM|nr:hypothetical protein [Pseudohongiella acticola]OFE11422.1 hypothetical protein PHACT_12765 [Pseudohongiella acticola]
MRKKYTEEDFHRLAKQTNRARWGLTIGFITWCIVAIIIESRGSEPEWIALPEYTEDGRQIVAQTEGPLHWPMDKVDLYYNSTGAPLDAGTLLAYSIWTWGQRVGLEITYKGLTYETAVDGAIVINWQSFFAMWAEHGSYEVKGYASSRYYPSTGELASSSIYLRDDLIGSPLLAVSVHEHGHALGIRGHNTDPNGVMYDTAPRYALTASDAALTAYDYSPCHAELSPAGDVYLPGVGGKGFTLSPVDDYYQITHEHDTDLYCTGFSGDGTVTITEVRGMDETYHDAVLAPINNDSGWQVVAVGEQP